MAHPRSALSVFTSALALFAVLSCGTAAPRVIRPGFATTAPATQPTAFRFAPIFTNNMVLQRDVPLPIFGTARPDDVVTITLLDQTREVVADKSGKWIAHFNPIQAGGPYQITLIGYEHGANRTITLTNVLAGEVWVCSGQSNMELLVKQCSNPDLEIKSANHPRIRINSSSPSFVKASGREWVECTPQCIPNCSAVAYFFGRELNADLNVPIGLVVRAVGGTVIKQWAPKSGEWIENDPELKPLNDDWKRSLELYPTSRKAYSAWQATTRQSKAGSALTGAPPVPFDPQRWGGIYDGQITPLQPFAIRGVIWYQGETDARNGREDDQRSTLPRMIRAWRKAWGEGEFPFLLVQLANDWGGSGFNKPPILPATPPDNQHWPWVREAQAIACKLIPNTAMACTIDLGGKIHFPGKQDVARRLARVAESQVYHLPIVANGPTYESMEDEGNAIRLNFTSVGHGLLTHD